MISLVFLHEYMKLSWLSLLKNVKLPPIILINLSKSLINILRSCSLNFLCYSRTLWTASFIFLKSWASPADKRFFCLLFALLVHSSSLLIYYLIISLVEGCDFCLDREPGDCTEFYKEEDTFSNLSILELVSRFESTASFIGGRSFTTLADKTGSNYFYSTFFSAVGGWFWDTSTI